MNELTLKDELARGILEQLKVQADKDLIMKSGNHDLFLNDMKQNDPNFEKQIVDAPKETIHCINRMFE